MQKKQFFHTILGFTQSYSGVLGDIEGFIQLIPGTYKCDKPINITCVENVHLKCYCIIGSFVKGIRQPTFFSLAPDKPPGHKICKS